MVGSLEAVTQALQSCTDSLLKMQKQFEAMATQIGKLLGERHQILIQRDQVVQGAADNLSKTAMNRVNEQCLSTIH